MPDGSQIDVLKFDGAAFDGACADLMKLVKQDFLPDALIAIRSGGMYVAEAMARAAEREIPILAITCRRPSTRYKSAFSVIKQVIAKLPRPLLDRLRMIEHKILTFKRAAQKPHSYEFDVAELAGLRDWMTTAHPETKILIVDDSVDSGHTLSFVSDTVHRLAPPAAMVRSAVITVTTIKPRVMPHYTLLQQRLCRFPWSLDSV